ncbi:hypothetical protein SAMN02745181_1179 [Rubritalea squalenifaciens DSM 18772]|uniref:Uncharacterized protein n=1 Tax=Rubritalea squalenifaciens DSM 18772 TaxID=1123071 RepID=A0A1M6GID5_9BACT|nr:hypothetical protein SAMN02745181_1179 [Rubritalea squalenifaciens DSM 18772]
MLLISKLLLVLSMTISLVNPVCCCSGVESQQTEQTSSCCGGEEPGDNGHEKDGTRFCDCHQDQSAQLDSPELPAPNEQSLLAKHGWEVMPRTRLLPNKLLHLATTVQPPPLNLSQSYCVYLL